MFLKKSGVALKEKIQRLRYKEFSVADGLNEASSNLFGRTKKLYGIKGENCDLSSGIRAGYGMTDYTVEDVVPRFPSANVAQAIAEWTYKNADGETKVGSMYVTNAGDVYLYNEPRRMFLKQEQTLSGRVKILPYYGANGEEKLLICSEGSVMTYDSTAGFCELYAEGRPLACVFHDRIWFVCDRSRLRFSEPLNELEWSDDADGSGYLDLPDEAGRIVGIEAVGERIYVFFRRGISVLDARGSAREFRVEKIGFDGGNILEGSVAKCGDEVFFLTRDSVWVFDGKRAEKAAKNLSISARDDWQVCDETVFEGKVFFTYTDVSGKKKRLVFDAKNRTWYFMAAAFEGMSATNGKLLAFYDGEIRSLYEGGTLPSGASYRCEIPFNDFGIAERKVLRSLRFTGEGQMQVAVSNGRTRLSFPIRFSDGEARTFPILKGRRFWFEFTLEGGCKISSLEVEFGTYGDVGRGGELW